MTDSQRAAQETLNLFVRAKTGVKFVSPILFEHLTPAEVEALKERVRWVIDKWRPC
jgi:hypothetical protein